MRGFLLACGLSAVACGFGACGGSAFTAGGGDDGGTGEGGSSGGDDGGSSSSSGSSSGGSSGSSSGGSSGSSGSGSGSSGGVDAGPPGRWCDQSPQSTMTFCEDFDEHNDVTSFLGSWSTFEQNNGTFSFDRTAVPSPPNALRVLGNTGAQVLAVKTFPPLSAHPKVARLEFTLRINQPGSVGPFSAAGFAAIAYGTSIESGYAAMAIGNGPVITAAWGVATDAGAGDAGTFQATNVQGPFPPTGTWAGRFAIEIDYGSAATAGACAQVYQGPTALLKDCMQLPPSLQNPGVFSVVIGDDAVGLGGTGVIDLEFDDLTFDVR